MRLVVPEVEGGGQLAVALTNCTLYFLTKWLCLHLVEHLEALQHPVGLGNERLADVEAGNRSRSKSWTLWPCWAMRVETVEPPQGTDVSVANEFPHSPNGTKSTSVDWRHPSGSPGAGLRVAHRSGFNRQPAKTLGADR